jgi:hypothetical protein
MRQTTTGKSLQLLIQVIGHAPDGWVRVIQQEVCGASIPIVRKTHAAGVRHDPLRKVSKISAMDMTIDADRRV